METWPMLPANVRRLCTAMLLLRLRLKDRKVRANVLKDSNTETAMVTVTVMVMAMVTAMARAMVKAKDRKVRSNVLVVTRIRINSNNTAIKNHSIRSSSKIRMYFVRIEVNVARQMSMVTTSMAL